MKSILLLLIFVLTGCDPFLNEEEATLVNSIAVDGVTYSYYKQEMWDATLQFIVKSEGNPKLSLSSPKGKLEVSEERLVVKDFKQPNYLGKIGLELNESGVVFCGGSGCKNITSRSSAQPSAAGAPVPGALN